MTEVEDSGGGLDSCLQFLDETAGRWPTALSLSLLGLAVDCTASRHRSRPSMENVSFNTIHINYKFAFWFFPAEFLSVVSSRDWMMLIL